MLSIPKPLLATVTLLLCALIWGGCGGDPTLPISNTPPGDRDFAYSPGGDSLLVTYGTDSTFEELVLVDLTTGARTHLGFYGARVSWRAGRSRILLSVGMGSALYALGDPLPQALPFPGVSPFATWHPTAPLIAVTSNNAVNTNPPDVWLSDSVGGSFHRVPLGVPPHNETDVGSWSPDGTRLVASEVGRLVVFDTLATQVAYITPEGVDAYFPEWSPNGAWITFHAGSSVYLVRPDGTERHKLYAGGFYPRWRPDGSRIGFIGIRDGVFAVWSVDTLGKDLRQETFPE